MKQKELVKLVAHALGELNEKSFFVGGITVPFYLPDELKFAARPTEDVDIVVEVMQVTNREEFEKKLQRKGFRHDIQSKVLCRWMLHDIMVDIMSPNEKVFGFTNRWYAEGIKNYIRSHACQKNLPTLKGSVKSGLTV